MRSVPWITLYVGLLIGGGFGIGTLFRWRFGRSVGERRAEIGSPPEPGRLDPALFDGAVEALLAVGWSFVSLVIIDAVAPGSVSFRDSSAIGFLSSQTLTAWESASLWASLALLCGLMFPPPFRPDRGSSGLAGAFAVVAFRLPIIAFVAAAGFFASQLVGGNQRRSLTVALVAMPFAEWVSSMFGIRAAWGFVHGPETAIWVAVLVGALAARRIQSPSESA